jgi:Fe-S-cluster containining protein
VAKREKRGQERRSAGSNRRPPHRSPRHRQPLARRWVETACDCELCRHACLNSPGWFLPRQIAQVAEHLGLEIPELFARYLGLSETVTADGERRQGVMPHKLRDGKKPGSRWTLVELERPGRCVFFDRGRCTIYPVRPFECSRMHHEHTPAKTGRLRSDVAAAWTPAELAPYCKLAGRGGPSR